MSQNKIMIFLSTLVFIMLSISLYISSNIIQKSIKTETQSYLKEMNIQAAHIINNCLEGDYTTMRVIATFIAEFYSGETKEEIIAVLKKETLANNSKRMALVSKNGDSLTTDGVSLNLQDRTYIQKAFLGKESFSEKLIDKTDGQDIIVLAVPIWLDGLIDSVLITTYNADNLTNQLSVESFDAQGYSYLINQSGQIIGSSFKNTDKDITNFFEAISLYPQNIQVAEKIKTDIANNESGVAEYFYIDSNRYLNYTKIKNKDLYVFSIVPEEIIEKETTKRLFFSIALAAVIIVCIAILVVYILIYQKGVNRKLEQSYNKIKADEKRIKAIVETARLAIWEYDFDTQESTYNKYLALTLGITGEDIVHKLNYDYTYIYPSEMQTFLNTLEHLDGDISQAFEYRLLHQDGHWHWFRCFLNVLKRNKNGKIIKLAGINIDIHEYKLMELLNEESIGELENKVLITNSELEFSQKMLTKQKNLLFKVLEITPIAVGIVTDGFSVYQNSAMMKLLGNTIGFQVDMFYVHAEDRTLLLEVLEKEQSFLNRRVTLKSVSGEIKQTLFSVIIFEYQGKASELSWVFDISDLIQVQKDLELARFDAENANRAKSEFLANMSHEIRTPMNGIMGLTYLAMQSQDISLIHNHLSKIDASAQSLLYIINDILDYSKIEAGMLTLESTELVLSDVVNIVVEPISFLASNKKLEFILEIDPVIPQLLIGDPVRLGQVLLNLLNNAVKFTKQGEVRLEIILLKQIDNVASIYFSVSDTGIGIDMPRFKQLFTAFSQEDSSVTRKYGGTGLGLAISKSLVGQMGGIIEVESHKNVGSNFYFTIDLPVQIETNKITESYELNDDALSCLKGKKILLVEDNEINQLIASELLSQMGFVVDLANNGQEAVAQVFANDYDLVLMDIQMPEMDGLEATRVIRKNPKYQDLIIIAMTAHAMTGDYEKSIDVGMQDHITKPIDLEKLQVVLLNYLV